MKNKNVEKNNGFDLNSVKELRDGYKRLEENERNRVDKKGKRFTDILKMAAIVGVTLTAIGMSYFAMNRPKQRDIVNDNNSNSVVTKTDDNKDQNKDQEVVTEKVETNKGSSNRGYCPPEEKMKETNENSKEETTKTTSKEEKATVQHVDNSKEEEETTKAVEEAKEKGDKVQTGLGQNNANKNETNKDTTITTVTKTEEPEKQKEEDTNKKKVNIDTSTAKDAINENKAKEAPEGFER